MKKSFLLFSIVALGIFAATGLHAKARKNPQDILRRYEPILLRIHGVEKITLAACDRASGELAQERQADAVPCIAVKVDHSADLRQIETIFPNPMLIDGILVHFTTEEIKIPKGGVTINN